MVNEWIARAREMLAARSARERQFVTYGGLALLAILAYGVVYEPLRAARAKLAERLPVQRTELRLMQVQAAEIERLRSQMGNTGGLALEQRIKSSAAALELGEAFTRFTVLTEDQIQLSTHTLPNAIWIDWLADLEGRGVNVTRCRIDASDQSGQASLELSLRGGRR